MAANNKLKEVKQEIAQEKARYLSLEKKTGEKMSLQAKEIQALHARMQQTHETHMVEKNSLQARMSQMENQMGPGNQNLIQKLTDVRTPSCIVRNLRLSIQGCRTHTERRELKSGSNLRMVVGFLRGLLAVHPTITLTAGERS